MALAISIFIWSCGSGSGSETEGATGTTIGVTDTEIKIGSFGPLTGVIHFSSFELNVCRLR